ncbi:MAG: hypothetical protein HOW73_30130 [Polyangiaceae bacterium]|nr:hypothetical protein [Polyangiaceae bacterium]
MKQSWKVLALPVVVLGVGSPMLASCEALNSVAKDPTKLAEAAEGCPEFDKGDFSGIQLDAKLRGLLDASAKFDKVAADMEMGLIQSCGELGKALKMNEADLKAEPKDGEGAKKVCGAVAGKLDAFMKANASAKISVTVTAPKCYADIDAMTKCFEECGSPVSPGEFKASCQGGEVSGECSGKCEGSCDVEPGSASCKGSCKGSCSGKCEASFSGKCGGNCKGKCDGKNATGKCAGTCEGSCDAQAEGSCGGQCDGSCSASCEVKAPKAKCEGRCSGSCDVEMKAPSCSGEFKPPKVSIECQASCAAKAQASLKCDPPGVVVLVNGQASAEVTAVVEGLKKALPKIAEINLTKGKAVLKAGEQLVGQVKGATDAIGKAGVKAATCATVAVAGVGSAVAGISASVEVSASVNVSATGSASAGGKAGG